MGFMDGIKARKAMIKHQKGNIEEAKAEYKALYEGGYISAMYLMPYTVLLLRDGEVLPMAQCTTDEHGLFCFGPLAEEQLYQVSVFQSGQRVRHLDIQL